MNVNVNVNVNVSISNSARRIATQTFALYYTDVVNWIGTGDITSSLFATDGNYQLHDVPYTREPIYQIEPQSHLDLHHRDLKKTVLGPKKSRWS